MRCFFACLLIACLGMTVPQAVAQTPPIQKEVDKKLDRVRAEKNALEQLIAEALKNNPDIRLAESKVRDAEAELQRTRMKVLADVTLVQLESQAAQTAVDQAAVSYLDLQKQHEAGRAPSAHLAEAKQLLAKNKAALAVIQARLPYLLGRADLMNSTTTSGNISINILNALRSSGDINMEGSDEAFLRRLTLDLLGRPPTPHETQDFMKLPAKDRRKVFADQLLKKRSDAESRHERAQGQKEYEEAYRRYSEALLRARAETLARAEALKAPSPLTEKLRKALDAPMQFEASSITPLEALDHLRNARLEGFNLVVRATPLKKEPLDIQIKAPIPAGAFLEYLEDELGVVFVLRDYGIVVVGANSSLPPGAVRVVEVWKSGRIAHKESQGKSQK